MYLLIYIYRPNIQDKITAANLNYNATTLRGVYAIALRRTETYAEIFVGQCPMPNAAMGKDGRKTIR